MRAAQRFLGALRDTSRLCPRMHEELQPVRSAYAACAATPLATRAYFCIPASFGRMNSISVLPANDEPAWCAWSKTDKTASGSQKVSAFKSENELGANKLGPRADPLREFDASGGHRGLSYPLLMQSSEEVGRVDGNGGAGVRVDGRVHGDLPMQKELVCRGVDQRVIAVTCMYVIAIEVPVIAAAVPISSTAR